MLYIFAFDDLEFVYLFLSQLSARTFRFNQVKRLRF